MTTLSTAPAERSLRVWDDQLRVRVLEAGSGPPLVYFHPAAGLVWDGFLEALTRQFTVYAPEHPGTTPGDPRAIDRIDDLWDLVVMYQEVLEQLGLERPMVIGQSFGGMIACEVAAYAPEKVSKLVLLDPIGLWRDDAPVANWMAATPPELVRMLFYDPAGPAASQMFSAPADPEQAAVGAARLVWALGCTGKFAWPIPDRGLAKRLHRITAPTLIVWGQADRLMPVVYAEEFGRRIANSRVEIVEQCGHIPQLEQFERTSELVLAFLAG
jgi:pimeloyl-ACP methyl ester carboxylesterase